MTATLKNIHTWNPAKVTRADLTQAFSLAESQSSVAASDILFAQGLVQKFKGLMLSSMGYTRLTQEQFDQMMCAPVTALSMEARRWRILCAQVMLWLEEHSLEDAVA